MACTREGLFCCIDDELDYLADRTTAFRTYADLAATCDSGYVPTLRRYGAHLHLGMRLVEDGYRVFWRK